MNDPNFVYFVLFVVINFLTTKDTKVSKEENATRAKSQGTRRKIARERASNVWL